MTFIRKYSGDSKSLIAAEYECPVHGRFVISIKRDLNGDAPGEAKCMTWSSDGLTYCGEWALWRFPRPAGLRVQRVTAARRGKDPEAPPGAFDWRSLADGQDHDEWEAKERKKDIDYVYNSVKKQVVG